MKNENRILVVASSNKGKIAEITHMASGLPLTIIPMGEYLKREISIEENGMTFEENACIKAAYLYTHHTDSNMLVLADDSGLEVDALDGRPGVYSARFAGHDSTDKENCEKLKNLLMNVEFARRTARFHCVMALYGLNEKPVTVHGTLEGRIISDERGSNGFGYDPLFVPTGYDLTLAELSMDEKNKISHRALALKKIFEIIKNNLNK